MKTLIATLTLVVALVGTASAQHHGSWEVVQATGGGKFFVAFTSSENGDMLRYLCGAERCAWALTSRTPCDSSGGYGALASKTPGGSQFFEMKCMGEAPGTGWFDVVFLDQEAATQMIREKGVIGFAVALESGRFKVSRFVTEGAVAAMWEAERKAQTKTGTPGTPAVRRGPKDEVL
jgi:hypothetical protein